MAILAEGLERSFRDFARQCGRLKRLVQKKKGCPIPSDGFNQLLLQSMDDIDRSFQIYVRRKNELLSYIRATGSPREIEEDVYEVSGQIPGIFQAQTAQTPEPVGSAAPAPDARD